MRYYDVHGIVGIKVASDNDPITNALHKDLQFFHTKLCEPDVNLNIGPFPAEVVASGFLQAGNLLYDANEEKAIVLVEPKPSFTTEDILYVMVGDVRKGSKLSVYFPNLTDEKIGHWETRIKKLFFRESYEKDVAYRKVDRILSAILEPSLYYLLPHRGYSLLHAAAVSKNKGVLFFGPPNVGKTTMTLGMVARGWKFMGDDLILVDTNGNVLAYPKTIKLEGQNVAAYPALLEGMSSDFGVAERFQLRRRLRDAAKGEFDVTLHASISELFGDAEICSKTGIDYVVRISRDARNHGPALRELDTNTCADSLSFSLFWEFDAQDWRHDEYRYCSSSVLNSDFIREEAIHHERIKEIISKTLLKAKTLELLLPNDYSKTNAVIDLLLSSI